MAVRLSKSDYAALKAGKLPPQSEESLQEQIVAALRARGYTVLVTSRRRKKCRKCGSYDYSGDGVDKGLGDLLVTAAWMPAWLWVAMEVKKAGPIKWSSPEQKSLYERAKIMVVQSVEDALGTMEGVHGDFK